MNYKENWCVSYQSAPVESAWTIITMVTKDLGRQSLFIPVHSFALLFSHIKSWKNIRRPAPHVVLALCEPQPSLPLPSVSSMPAASCAPGSTPAHLLCDVLSWAPFTLRDLCMRELESMLSDGRTSSVSDELIHSSCPLTIAWVYLNDCWCVLSDFVPMPGEGQVFNTG